MAYCIRHGWNANPYLNREYVIADISICFSLLFTAVLSGSYSDILKRGKGKELVAVFTHALYSAAVALMIFFAAKMTEEFSRISFFLMPVIYIALSYGLHLLRKAYLYKRGGNHIRSFLVIADADKAILAVKLWKTKKEDILRQSEIVMSMGKKIAGIIVIK